MAGDFVIVLVSAPPPCPQDRHLRVVALGAPEFTATLLPDFDDPLESRCLIRFALQWVVIDPCFSTLPSTSLQISSGFTPGPKAHTALNARLPGLRPPAFQVKALLSSYSLTKSAVPSERPIGLSKGKKSHL
ncbi:hypothetical protein D9615_004346 [Tricholomella constricta]|uniref:Uncharacterized protein n=1 Tax=Tricholomella constricta TaxID=117010 RepID=A0A8H5HET6_9AGAR|nr:hypothetical protein D9615_004346 [Tricholomella constricta]